MNENFFNDIDIHYLGVVDQQFAGGIVCEKYDIATVNEYDRQRHYHTFYELHFITSGSVLFDVNNLKILHKEGTMHLVRPKDHHTLISIGSAEYYSIKFSGTLIDTEIIQTIENDPHILTVRVSSDKLDAVKADCEQIYALCSASDDRFRKQELSMLLQLFLIRFLREVETDPQIHPMSVNEYSIISRVLEYVRNHYSEDISLMDVSSYVGFSRNYFSALFSSVMNMTFWNYLSVYRLERAKLMLTSTNESIAQIAYVCGFNSYSAFIKAFRGRYKLSPSQYRDRK